MNTILTVTPSGRAAEAVANGTLNILEKLHFNAD